MGIQVRPLFATIKLVNQPLFWYRVAMRTDQKSPSSLEQVLGTRSKVAVLRSLFHSKLGHSGGAIARLTGVALFAVQKTLASLEGVGLVNVERGPVENRYRLNDQHYLVAHGLRALFEGERHMPKAIARELGDLLEDKVIAAGLFGSFARGAARTGSDIDLFVVVKTLKDREEVSRILSDAQPDLTRRYGWPVQAVIFERRRLSQGLKKGQTLLDEATGDWQHVAGLTPRELRKSLVSAKTRRPLP
jgi:predicted nucleotidyltransferase